MNNNKSLLILTTTDVTWTGKKLSKQECIYNTMSGDKNVPNTIFFDLSSLSIVSKPVCCNLYVTDTR
jgi:hypothetical protein